MTTENTFNIGNELKGGFSDLKLLGSFSVKLARKVITTTTGALALIDGYTDGIAVELFDGTTIASVRQKGENWGKSSVSAFTAEAEKEV